MMSEEERIERVIEGLGIAVGDDMTVEEQVLFFDVLLGKEPTPTEEEVVNELSERVARQILASLDGIQ